MGSFIPAQFCGSDNRQFGHFTGFIATSRGKARTRAADWLPGAAVLPPEAGLRQAADRLPGAVLPLAANRLPGAALPPVADRLPGVGLPPAAVIRLVANRPLGLRLAGEQVGWGPQPVVGHRRDARPEAELQLAAAHTQGARPEAEPQRAAVHRRDVRLEAEPQRAAVHTPDIRLEAEPRQAGVHRRGVELAEPWRREGGMLLAAALPVPRCRSMPLS